MPKDIVDSIMDHMEVTHIALEKSAALEEHLATIKKQSAVLIPPVVQRMVEFGCLDEGDAQKCASRLLEPEHVMTIFSRFTEKLAQKIEKGTLGVRSSELDPAGAPQQKAAALKPPSPEIVRAFHAFGLPTPSGDPV